MNILVIDNQKLFAENLIYFLKNETNLENFKLIADIDLNSIDQYLHTNETNLVLLNANLTTHNAIELGRNIIHRHSSIQLVFYSDYKYNHHLFEAKKMNADAYLLKTQAPEEFVNQLFAIMTKNAKFIDDVIGDKILTQKELETLDLINNGFTYEKIAGKLSLSRRSVDYRMSSIKKKLAANTLAESVSKGIGEGAIQPTSIE